MYALAGVSAMAISLIGTPAVRRLALKVGAIDYPGAARKVHRQATARLGGLAIYLAIILTAAVSLDLNRQFWGLAAGLTLLVVVGAIDDLRGLSPGVKLGGQLLAAGLALAGGIGITTLTNPWGGVIALDRWRLAVDWAGLRFHIMPVANLVSLIWMVGLINVINFLDGLDGLAAGVSGIAAAVLLILSASTGQPAAAILAAIVVGATLGFLPYNFHPARIFMGDSGSYVLGLTLALLSVYSGAKIATAGLVLGFTILDGLWTVLRRVLRGASPFTADRLHLHHLLIDIGFSHRQTVVGLYGLSALFGLLALVGGSLAKLVALGLLVMTMVLILGTLAYIEKKKRKGRI
jgi:UDP-GlcNAc:undecaprenyl-phosphate GlcNAc-1-phosphate transferase